MQWTLINLNYSFVEHIFVTLNVVFVEVLVLWGDCTYKIAHKHIQTWQAG